MVIDESQGAARLLSEQSAAIAHYKKMYDRVSALAKIGVWECDLATEELTWTDEVYDLFDVPRGSKVERARIVELYDVESRCEMERLRAEAIRTGGGFSLDVLIRTKKGREQWIRLTADVEQVDGQSVRIFGTKQDISQEKQAQEKLQFLQNELIHVSRVSAMNAMASTLAHELNQPLAAACNYLSTARRLLEPEGTPSELAECVTSAADSARLAGEIIRRLREMTVKGQPSQARAGVESLLRDAVSIATAGRTDIAVRCNPGRDLAVNADRIQIQQVLINLIRNAYEASVDRCCDVEITASRTEDGVKFCVSDGGPGFPAHILPDVFNSLVTTKPQGMGIGLSVSRTIVEAHHGRIIARNKPGGGALICFTLPEFEASE